MWDDVDDELREKYLILLLINSTSALHQTI